MNLRHLLVGAAIGFAIAAAPSCGGSRCGASNCGGCCTSSGTCIARDAVGDSSCGSQGVTCADCAGGGATCNKTTFACQSVTVDAGTPEVDAGTLQPTSISGTVAGISLGVQDSIFFAIKNDADQAMYVTVLLTDHPNLCDTLKANRLPKSATSLAFSLLNVKVENDVATLLVPDVGSYSATDLPISQSGLYASSWFSRTDANCTDLLTAEASSGKSGLVKVTNLKAEPNGNLTAIFDVSIGTQADKLTGSINARFCDVTKLQANPNCE